MSSASSRRTAALAGNGAPPHSNSTRNHQAVHDPWRRPLL